MEMNEKSKKLIRNRLGKAIQHLSTLIEEDFEPFLGDVFKTNEEAMENSLWCAAYSINDILKEINSKDRIFREEKGNI